MNSFLLANNSQKKYQYILSVLIIILLLIFSFLFFNHVAYEIPFILLFAVLYIYIFLNIYPAVVAVLIAAVGWDLLFFRPGIVFFNLYSPQNSISIALFFLMLSFNAAILYAIKKNQKEATATKEAAKTIQLYDTLLNSL